MVMHNKNFFTDYTDRLTRVLEKHNWDNVNLLAEKLYSVWKDKKNVFLCGNGGSAANASHLANDFLYGVSPDNEKGIKAHALSSNPSVITCLANDISYDDIFSYQLSVLGNSGDILIALSGSGNSTNIIKAILKAKSKHIMTFAILGFSGGEALNLADIIIHFPIDDMQIAEDCQQIVGHMLMRRLKENPAL